MELLNVVLASLTAKPVQTIQQKMDVPYAKLLSLFNTTTQQ